MATPLYRLPRLLALAGFLTLAACASQSDIDDLRAELQQAQADAASANERAAAAEARAADAEAAAAAAQERAERIFRESLRK
ncbi:MAG: alanine-zipper protein [Pseudomonadota bacterium]